MSKIDRGGRGVADQETRPRFGQLTRQDGTVVPLVFHPTDEPMVFEGRRAGDEGPVPFTAGDEVTVDVIGAGQSVTFEVPE